MPYLTIRMSNKIFCTFLNKFNVIIKENFIEQSFGLVTKADPIAWELGGNMFQIRLNDNL
jgi:hypothetical protein